MRRPRPTVLLGRALALLVALAAAAQEAGRWRGSDGAWLPYHDDEEVLAFLGTAEVVEQKELTQGINRPIKMRLRGRDGIEAHAVFRTVNVRKARHETPNQVLIDFHDSYLYECAAWELSRLLGIDHVPPCVVREVEGRRGTLQLWVEKAMTEEKRRRKGEPPPNPIVWARQQQTLRLFDALVYNFDRNQGNMLIDPDWKLWFIDHTRSFARSTHVEELERLIWCERGVWQKLRALDRATVDGKLGELVDAARRDDLMARRDLLVAHLEKLIAERGEDVVLFDSETSTAGPADAAADPGGG